MLRVSTLTAALVGLVALVGCKGPYGADGICETQARAYCQFQYQCCNAAERQELTGGTAAFFPHSTQEECYEEMRKLACSGAAVYGDAARAGRIQWDEAKAQECLQPLVTAAETCDAEAFSAGVECEGTPWITGAVENGDTCYDSAECADAEATCVPNEPDDEDEDLVTAKGTCVPPPGEGESCLERNCRTGLWCHFEGETATCKAVLDNGESCNASYECESGNCAYDAQTFENVCAPKKANGEDCNASGECVSERCSFDTYTCEPKLANGEECFYSSDCQSDYCDVEESICKPEPNDEPETTYDICTGEG